jgi:CBS domain-containing protein
VPGRKEDSVPFIDRSDAGRRLAHALVEYKNQQPVVLALPRGGVPVAAEIAIALQAPLDLILVRKLGVPIQPELAMGAVVDGGSPLVVRNDDVIRIACMERHRIKRLPVVQDGKLVGIVSRANLLHALASVAREVKAPAGDDATIREQILAECAKQPWSPHVNVVVRDGVVGLWGAITDERERQAFVVAAENVPGVKAVHDHLAWIEPTSGIVIISDEDEAKARAS